MAVEEGLVLGAQEDIKGKNLAISRLSGLCQGNRGRLQQVAAGCVFRRIGFAQVCIQEFRLPEENRFGFERTDNRSEIFIGGCGPDKL